MEERSLPPGPSDPALVRNFRQAAREGVEGLFPDAPEADLDRLADEVTEGFLWLHRKWGDGRQCPYCGVSDWEVGFPVSFQVKPPVSSRTGTTSPAFYPITCRNCGNTPLVRVPLRRDEEGRLMQ